MQSALVLIFTSSLEPEDGFPPAFLERRKSWAGLSSRKQELCFVYHHVPSGPASALTQTRGSVNTGGMRCM